MGCMGVGVGDGVEVGVGVRVDGVVETGEGVGVAVVAVGVIVGSAGAGAPHAVNPTNNKRLIRKSVRDLMVFTPTIYFCGLTGFSRVHPFHPVASFRVR